MQPNLFPPTEPTERLRARFGFTLRKSLIEFEVIAEAVSRGFDGQGSLEEVYQKAVQYLMEYIDNERQDSSNTSRRAS